MNTMSSQPDLSTCDREPIHIPGTIQSFGAMVAVNSDWLVSRLSANAGEILGTVEGLETGVRLGEVLRHDAVEALRVHANDSTRNATVEHCYDIRLTDAPDRFDVGIHCSGRETVFEIEPADHDEKSPHPGELRPVMDELGKCETPDQLYARAADQLKQLVGFDRVMVYRFRPDESGEVIAEAREPELESFMTLRYPKTDIPAQARALYVRNLFRIIADVSSEPVPVEPTLNFDGEPLDMSDAVLRAVSPIHIEYLTNMGVTASLSISIVVDGKLWGLFACHHYSGPRVIPAPRRALAELFAQFFSLLLDRKLANEDAAQLDAGRRLHDRIMGRIVSGEDIVSNLSALDELVAPIVPHDGSSAYIGGEYNARGSAPNEEEFRAIVPALNAASGGAVIATDSLAAKAPKAEAFADRAVGALIIPVSRRPRDYVVLWRRELSQVVTWAGNPEKVAEYGPNGDRLTPRKSFAAWKETVRGTSEGWTRAERRVAESLRATLLEVILRLTDEAMRERQRAQEQQELLIAELNHRVRNILNLIRGLVGQSKGEARTVEQFSDIVGGRIAALSRAHDNITQENWNHASLRGLILSEAEAYLSNKADRVKITGADPLISPEAYTVLSLVLHEMTTNSAKYGALCDSRGQLDIALERNRDGDLEIAWRESGGPAVKPPTRRGFGSTIIERSIPFELKGDASIRYQLSGVEADFVIPGRYVEWDNKDNHASEKDEAREMERLSPASPDGKAIENVLLVEDNVIIAMDAEEAILESGVKTVRVASGVNQAISMIEKKAPDIALLDFNLGDETSEPIAARLRELGVPFYFATGYGDMVDKNGKKGALGVLQKPIAKEDLQSALGLGKDGN